MNKKTRKRRSSEELQTISNRLFYEWQMITRLASVLEPNSLDDQNEKIIGQGRKIWDFTEITDAIQPALERFVDLVKPEYLGDRWWNLVNDQKGYRWDELKNQIEAKNS